MPNNPTTRLLAFVGFQPARETLGWRGSDCCDRCGHLGEIHTADSCGAEPCDCGGLADWVRALIPMVQAGLTVMCSEGSDCAEWAGPCAGGCGDTGRVPDPHALLRLAVAVGWAVLPVWVKSEWRIRHGQDVMAEEYHIKIALNAADAYLVEPSEERLEAWDALHSDALPRWLPFSTGLWGGGLAIPSATKTLNAAAEVLPDFRAVASAWLIEAGTVACQSCMGEGHRLGHQPKRTCNRCHGTGRVQQGRLDEYSG